MGIHTLSTDSGQRFQHRRELWTKLAEEATSMLWRIAPQVFWGHGAKAEFPQGSFGISVGEAAVWYVLIGDQIERREWVSGSISVERASLGKPEAEFVRDICLSVRKGLRSVKVDSPDEDWVRIIVACVQPLFDGLKFRKVAIQDGEVAVYFLGEAVEPIRFTPTLIRALENGDDKAWERVVADFEDRHSWAT